MPKNNIKHPHGFGLAPKFENIPELLRDGPWCVWKARPKGNGKYDKIPFNGINTIKTTEPDTWLTFDQAQQLYLGGGFNGVGRLATKDGLAFIDIDDSNKLPDELKALGETYVERSPSGNGMRLVYQVDTPPAKDLKEPYEVYSGNSARFLTITGNTMGKLHQIARKNGQLAEIVEQYSQPIQPSPEQEIDDVFSGHIVSNTPIEEIRELLSYIPADNEQMWIDVSMALNTHFHGSTDGFELWDQWSQRSEKYDGLRDMRHEWDRFTNTERTTKYNLGSIAKWAKRYGADLSAIAKKHKRTKDIPTEYDSDEYQDEVAATSIPNALFVPLTDAYQNASHTVRWTIEGYVEQAAVVNYYGESGVGKSFGAIDIALSVATGDKWLGMRTKKGQVLYIAGEGHNGVNRRAYAWRSERNFPDASNFIMTNRAINLSMDKERKTLEAYLDKLDDPQLVVVDTWGRATAGINENSSEEVQPIIEYLTHISRKYDCTIMVVHHTPKHTTDSSAGSKNIKASMDVEIAMVRRDGINGVVMECRKMKEGPQFEPVVFEFVQIQLPSNYDDEYGNVTYSAILRASANSQDQLDSAKMKLSRNGKLLMDTIRYFMDNDPTAHRAVPPEATIEFPFATCGVAIDVDRVRDKFERDHPRRDNQSTVRGAWTAGCSNIRERHHAQICDGVFVVRV